MIDDFDEAPDETLLSVQDRRALELIYEEFRRRGDAPQVLRDFLYEQIGRAL